MARPKAGRDRDGPDLGEGQGGGVTERDGARPTSTDVLIDHMQRTKAFVFAAEEDFGIVSVESGCGAPVIALGKGGACETVIESADRNTARGSSSRARQLRTSYMRCKRFEAMGRSTRGLPSQCLRSLSSASGQKC